jgi:hypothetical protein
MIIMHGKRCPVYQKADGTCVPLDVALTDKTLKEDVRKKVYDVYQQTRVKPAVQER